VLANTREQIVSETEILLTKLVEVNQLEVDRIVSVFFTMTPDLNAEFPAVAARNLGWTEVPLICAVEIDVPDSVKKCIRLLLHYNATSQTALKPVYLQGAKQLRQDLCDD
ncbi:MAG: chorismate mutase, partial [Candidatus Margulisiibacteriota bacterium]